MQTAWAAPIERAPLAMVVCADTSLTDVWIEDCSIATHQIQLAAESLGLGSCWIQVRLREHDSNLSAEDYVRELLNLPQTMAVESILAIGYPAEEKAGIDDDELLRDRIHYNRFKQAPL